LDWIVTYGDPALEERERGGNPTDIILTAATEIRSNGFAPRDEKEERDGYDNKYDDK
jgi:hypothetical protein